MDDDTTTIRKLLTEAGFDFHDPNAWIVVQPGHTNDGMPSGPPVDVAMDDPRLDRVHLWEPHRSEVPSVVAFAGGVLYASWCYDGGSGIEAIPATKAGALASRQLPWLGG